MGIPVEHRDALQLVYRTTRFQRPASAGLGGNRQYLNVAEIPTVSGRIVAADRRGSPGNAWLTDNCGWELKALLANNMRLCAHLAVPAD